MAGFGAGSSRNTRVGGMAPEASAITLKAAATTGTGNASGNNQAAAVSGFLPYTTLQIKLQVLSMVGSSPTLDVAVQRLVPGGNASNPNDWDTIVRFAQVTTTGYRVADVVATGEGERVIDNTLTVTSATLGAGAVRNVPWGDTLRVIDTVGGTGSPAFNYQVIVQPRP